MTLSATDMTFLLVLFACYIYVLFATEITLFATHMTFLLVLFAAFLCFFATEITLFTTDMTFLLVLFAAFVFFCDRDHIVYYRYDISACFVCCISLCVLCDSDDIAPCGFRGPCVLSL